ncbi:transketolase [Verrucosispora sioxanthis]|uniref:Transketolase n=1 Tax=Verrucosispora sioxanthis TaxID=2499994 RepID=A0A6M1L9P3_9ACTN|nr:transketolase [Verrucosispora sioxanthis]NEE65888.1 transketolase [Verrucosispora sioxanthis]NGM14998.1 transketolase [Verrucosispora sioxanthis]
MTTSATTVRVAEAAAPIDGRDQFAPLLERVRAGRKFGANVLSTLDVLQVLYDRVLRITPATVDDPDRDRFLLSKGHAVAGYYALLAAKGFIPPDWLDDQGGPSSRLGDHPDRTLIPGVEIGSGSLGHGLGLGVGSALGLRAQGRLAPRVYVLLGDAELDEGSNHEAIAYAGAVGLGNLTAIVVDNFSATHGWPGGLATRFTANGWTAATVDGRDRDALHPALTGHHGHRPHVVVALVGDGE